MAKSKIRATAEEVLSAFGIQPGQHVYTDTHKTCQRVKFSKVLPFADTVNEMRVMFAARYPKSQTKVQVIKHTGRLGATYYDGLAFTVYND